MVLPTVTLTTLALPALALLVAPLAQLATELLETPLLDLTPPTWLTRPTLASILTLTAATLWAPTPMELMVLPTLLLMVPMAPMAPPLPSPVLALVV